MRITGGSLGGRIIRVPKGIRPTQDKIRSALFSALGAFVPGARVLDLFAGSGALGIEACSRGAASVCWVESDPRVFAVLQRNVDVLCGEMAAGRECRRADALRFLRSGGTGRPFDLAMADPPYERGAGRGWAEAILPELAGESILVPGGLVVIEQGSREPARGAPGLAVVRDKAYGDSRLVVYRRVTDEGRGRTT